MQMFKVMGGSIMSTEVTRVSDDSVWEVQLNGAEVRKLRQPKSEKQPFFFNTLEEAKLHLLEAAKAGVEVAVRRLDVAKARYQQIADMQ